MNEAHVWQRMTFLNLVKSIYCQFFYQIYIGMESIQMKLGMYVLGDIQCLINHVFWIITTLEHTTMDQSVELFYNLKW